MIKHQLGINPFELNAALRVLNERSFKSGMPATYEEVEANKKILPEWLHPFAEYLLLHMPTADSNTGTEAMLLVFNVPSIAYRPREMGMADLYEKGIISLHVIPKGKVHWQIVISLRQPLQQHEEESNLDNRQYERR